MPHFTELSTHVAEVAEQAAQRELLERWNRMVAEQIQSSVEIDALTSAEASAYVQQRRIYEQQSAVPEPSLSCR